MIIPSYSARLDLRARRGQPLARSIRFPAGVDLTGYTAESVVRDYPDGPVRISLPSVTYPIATTASPGTAVRVDTSGALPISYILLWAKQDVIDGLDPIASSGAEPRAELRKSWSCRVTPPSGVRAAWFVGDFFLVPGDPA